jgi:hypothetical protein
MRGSSSAQIIHASDVEVLMVARGVALDMCKPISKGDIFGRHGVYENLAS